MFLTTPTFKAYLKYQSHILKNILYLVNSNSVIYKPLGASLWNSFHVSGAGTTYVTLNIFCMFLRWMASCSNGLNNSKINSTSVLEAQVGP